VLIDDNAALRALALDFVKGSARLGELTYDKGEASDLIAKSDAADLVIASYMIGELGERYNKATGTSIIADFGPSGALRERIEKGERADLFASADIGHPLKLLADGRAIRVDMFTRNALCAFAAPKVGLTSANFVDRLLDPAVKLGTSTPKSDPSGDYTWLMFRRMDAARPGGVPGRRC